MLRGIEDIVLRPPYAPSAMPGAYVHMKSVGVVHTVQLQKYHRGLYFAVRMNHDVLDHLEKESLNHPQYQANPN